MEDCIHNFLTEVYSNRLRYPPVPGFGNSDLLPGAGAGVFPSRYGLKLLFKLKGLVDLYLGKVLWINNTKILSLLFVRKLVYSDFDTSLVVLILELVECFLVSFCTWNVWDNCMIFFEVPVSDLKKNLQDLMIHDGLVWVMGIGQVFLMVAGMFLCHIYLFSVNFFLFFSKCLHGLHYRGIIPPGARYDPIGPSGVPGFEPGRFIR